jgi:uncharacterized protein YegL
MSNATFEALAKQFGVTPAVAESIDKSHMNIDVVNGERPNMRETVCVTKISILIDMSGSMDGVTHQIREALVSLPNTLKKSFVFQTDPDSVFVQILYFNHEVTVALPWTKLADMESKFDPSTYCPNGGTLLYTAMRDQIIGLQTGINDAKNHYVRTQFSTIILTDGDTSVNGVDANDIKQQLAMWQSEFQSDYYSCYIGAGDAAVQTGLGLGYHTNSDLLTLPDSNTFEFAKKVRNAIHLVSHHCITQVSKINLDLL